MEMFCPDTPSFCDHIWSRVELFSDLQTKDDAGALQCVIGYMTSLYLVMSKKYSVTDIRPLDLPPRPSSTSCLPVVADPGFPRSGGTNSPGEGGGGAPIYGAFRKLKRSRKKTEKEKTQIFSGICWH